LTLTVRFGIVGTGYMGRTYAACLAGMMSGASLVAVTCGGRSRALAHEFEVAAEPDLDALLARPDIDAVIIATPHSCHLDQTVSAAAAGKHVFVEKPMARDVAECDAMITACRHAGVKLAVNKVLRFRDAPRAARATVESGAIGEVRMMKARYSYAGSIISDKRWTHDREEGSPFLNWGAHCADLFRWITGDEAVRAFALYGSFRPTPPSDQTAMVEFNFARGALAQSWMSFELPRPGLLPADTYLIVGSRGMVELETFGQVRLGNEDGWRVVAEQPKFDFLADPLNPNRLKGFAAQLADFVEAIVDEREPVVTGEDGRAAVEMVEAADRSAASRRSVPIPFAALHAPTYTERRILQAR
jgi:predicted dehydrogenase